MQHQRLLDSCTTLSKQVTGLMQEAMERGWFMTEDSVMKSAPASDLMAVYATAKDIASAMAYIHSKDIIHGDLRGDSLGLASSSQDQRGFIAKVTLTHHMQLHACNALDSCTKLHDCKVGAVA